jgi:hypothetical protein
LPILVYNDSGQVDVVSPCWKNLFLVVLSNNIVLYQSINDNFELCIIVPLPRDILANRLKVQVEQISFAHTLKVLGGKVSIVFYDMITLYFEASNENEYDLRKTGFSKDGKH